MLPISSVAGGPRAQALAGPARRSLGAWIVRRREWLWAGLIVLIAALAHGYNMFGFLYYESDEGTYMSQAWAVVRLGALAPYTYWYDHAPGGWLQIGLWSTITGGFYSFGSPVNSGRVLMLLMQIGSVGIVYRIARNTSRGIAAPTIAALAFALSVYGTYYHRRVLLDNITTFWMLLSIMLLIERQLPLKRVWLSGLALGISILSKELTIFLVPVLALVVWQRVGGPQRWIAVSGWLAIVGSIFSTYLLFATLKGELFPAGTWLGGTADHVSLLGSLAYQSSRENDGGLLDPSSGFWSAVRNWSAEEPLLLFAGTASAVLSVALLRWRRMAGMLGLATLSLWAFVGRGGVTLPFYLVPLLPLLAINLGLVLALLAEGMRALCGRYRRVGLAVGAAGQLAALAGVLAFTLPGYRNPHLEFGGDPLVLWRGTQADVNKLATDWIIQNIPRGSRIIINQSMWLDLHEIPGQSQGFDNAHYYWKVQEDKAIRDGVFEGDWRATDYVITTNQLLGDTSRSSDTFVKEALRHSTLVAAFDTGGWPVEVRQVHRPYQAAPEQVLAKTWASYCGHFIADGQVIDRGGDGRTPSEGQGYALLRAVYADDRQTFDQVWDWTQQNLQQPSGLLAWHWGARPDGTPGVLDAGAAPDADQDAALALLFAFKRWGDPRHQQAAFTILNGIWEQTTSQVGGRRVLVPGAWACGDATSDAVVNPSYFAPYAYRIFAEADPRHGWLDLVDSSYAILDQVRADARFGGSAGLAPNWLALDPASGALRPASQFGDYASEFSFDASRLAWRLAVDWLWFQDPRARAALEGLDLPERAYGRDGKLVAAYGPDGQPLVGHEALSMYAGAIGQLMFSHDRQLPQRVYARHLAVAYRDTPAGAYWGDPNNCYDQNWAWFATALANGKLGNLWAGKSEVFYSDLRVN
ncbi:MAG TPA: glycosyl hydrolase family 8 [Roseiflexaceae bacterium]|nr:glycosyl hydrolase family 8 [Roseiflexaceae bacterium]